jgi:hypothetical protein
MAEPLIPEPPLPPGTDLPGLLRSIADTELAGAAGLAVALRTAADELEALRAALATRAEPLGEGVVTDSALSWGIRRWITIDFEHARPIARGTRVVVYEAVAGSATPTEHYDHDGWHWAPGMPRPVDDSCAAVSATPTGLTAEQLRYGHEGERWVRCDTCREHSTGHALYHQEDVAVSATPEEDDRTAERALYDFLEALLVAKRNDDVISVVDAMLAVHVEAVAGSATPQEDK